MAINKTEKTNGNGSANLASRVDLAKLPKAFDATERVKVGNQEFSREQLSQAYWGDLVYAYSGVTVPAWRLPAITHYLMAGYKFKHGVGSEAQSGMPDELIGKSESPAYIAKMAEKQAAIITRMLAGDYAHPERTSRPMIVGKDELETAFYSLAIVDVTKKLNAKGSGIEKAANFDAANPMWVDPETGRPMGIRWWIDDVYLKNDDPCVGFPNLGAARRANLNDRAKAELAKAALGGKSAPATADGKKRASL